MYLYLILKLKNMKKIFFLFAIASFTTASFAQTTKQPPVPPAPPAPPTVNAHSPQVSPVATPNVADAAKAQKGKQPKIEFKDGILDLDYGTIKKSSEPFREFEFKNTGKAPLIISNAVGSCGCTIPTYPKEPVMPGKKAVIKVRYDTERVGAFTKNVTLTTNVIGQESVKLTIHGNVLAPETTSNTTTPPVETPKH
jgi:hypothetical protein